MKLYYKIALTIILLAALILFVLVAGKNIGADIGTFVYNITH